MAMRVGCAFFVFFERSDYFLIFLAGFLGVFCSATNSTSANHHITTSSHHHIFPTFAKIFISCPLRVSKPL